MDVTTLDAVYEYWFGDLKAYDQKPDEQRQTEWFRPTEAIDAHIRDTWGPHIEAAGSATWDLAKLTRRQQVALVVVLDQFPRQIHRTSGQAFARDAAALAVARELVAGGWRRFFIVEQSFVFLPFEHSEEIADQDRCVLLYAERAVEAPQAHREGCRWTLDFATKHRDIIRRFGRFPHRNVMLGRLSTPEEIEFLKGGRGF